jgi:hypothetical protein
MKKEKRKKNKGGNLFLLCSLLVVICSLLTGCASGAGSKPAPASSGVNTGSSLQTAKDAGRDELDHALREISDYLNKRIPAGSKAVFLNVKSDWPDLSEYILSGLTENAVNDEVFSVVDRQQLDAIRSELNFQWSGEVSDTSAQEIGQMLGAQTIISGTVTTVGSVYRIQARAIAVQTAAVQGQFSQNVDGKGPIIAALTERKAPAGSGSSAAATASTGARASAGTQAAQTPAAPPAAPAAPVQTAGQNQTQPGTTTPQPKISTDRAGLYVDGAYQGQTDLLDSIDWIKLNARSGGNYVIALGKDEAVPYIMLNFNNLQLSVTLKASGAERRVRYDNSRPSYSMFVVGTGVTFILEEGITLAGLQSNSKPLVRVEGGAFIMNGGSIKDNKLSGASWEGMGSGGGVYIASGAFTMNNGTISGNDATHYIGGGVYVSEVSSFTMNNGTINGNNARYGGGVYVVGTFTMLGGAISGNTAEYGGGVHFSVGRGVVFTKSGTGGIIYGSNAPDEQANKASRGGHAVSTGNGSNGYNSRRNSTARVSQALDSRKSGAAGGWE